MVRVHPCPHMKTKNTTIQITDKTAGQRLDMFLTEKLKLSRSQAQKLVSDGLILVNNVAPTKTGKKLSINDTIEFLPAKKIEKTLTSKSKHQISEPSFTIKDIKIIAETPDYFVVEKPAGMLTHSTEKGETDSLAELMSKKYPALKKVGEDPIRPGIVHRLDKEASGLIVVARTQKMFNHLKDQFKNRTIDKKYSVLVHGVVSKDFDNITFRLSRSETSDRMAAIPTMHKGLTNESGKDALTEYDVVKRFINFTLLDVKIHTGRMHQIRVHMLAYNHPVVCDSIYFQKKRKKKWDTKLGRLFLHCTNLGFTDLDGERQNFSSTLPPTLANFLEHLK